MQIDCITGCSGGGGSSSSSPTPTGPAGSPNANVVSVQGVANGTALQVAGTFFQVSQPVSAAALPLPAGAATSARQDALLTALGAPLQAGGSVTVSNLPATQPVSASSLPLPTGAATASGVAAVVTALGSPLQSGGAVTVTGVSTAANQATANTSLASILAQLQATLTTRTAPFTTATPLAPGTPVAAGRALFLACTAAGSVRIKLSSGNTLDVPVYVGPERADELRGDRHRRRQHHGHLRRYGPELSR